MSESERGHVVELWPRAHLEDPAQKPVVDGPGGTDGPVGEEESPEAGEDGVGPGDGAVHRQVKPHVGAHVV